MRGLGPVKRLWGSLNLLLHRPTGVERNCCIYCGSKQIVVRRRRWLQLPYEIPKSAKPIADQMHRRDNGRCKSCGLEQSFYVFSEAGRKQLYDFGLDVLSDDPRFGVYPPDPQFRKLIFDCTFSRRVPKWRHFFQTSGMAPIRRILVLRCFYGEVLEALREWGEPDLWAKEMTHTCERFVKEHLSYVNVPTGNLAGRIELNFGNQNPKFDLIICMHTLTHSINIREDLDCLRTLLKPKGAIVFCDEITKKPHNPFHMIHLDEMKFVDILEENFGHVDRIDDCGTLDPNVTPYTQKGDNPDLVAWAAE